jgi:uncharacterized protein
MRHLGSLYEKGDGVPLNPTTAMQWYEKAANTGDATAMRKLGNLYFLGQEVPQDYQQAKR